MSVTEDFCFENSGLYLKTSPGPNDRNVENLIPAFTVTASEKENLSSNYIAPSRDLSIGILFGVTCVESLSGR